MARDPLRFMDSTDAANEADSATVAELLAVFDSSRLTRDAMSLSDLLDLNHTLGDLKECIETVRPLVVQGNFDGLWAKAYGAGVVAPAQTMTLRGLFRFRGWVISPNGQATLRAFLHEQKQKQKHKLSKNLAGEKGVSEQERQKKALLRLFTEQKEARAAKIAAARAERDRKLARLRRKIEKANKAFEDTVAAIRAEYGVLAGYVPPDAAFVREQCWNAYVAECQAEGRTPETARRDLEDRYGQVVRDRHLVAYLRRPEVKEALLAYGREKLQTFKDEGNHRGFAEFRGLLEIASGGSVSIHENEITPARREDSEVGKPPQTTTTTTTPKGSRKRKQRTSARSPGTC